MKKENPIVIKYIPKKTVRIANILNNNCTYVRYKAERIAPLSHFGPARNAIRSLQGTIKYDCLQLESQPFTITVKTNNPLISELQYNIMPTGLNEKILQHISQENRNITLYELKELIEQELKRGITSCTLETYAHATKHLCETLYAVGLIANILPAFQQASDIHSSTEIPTLEAQLTNNNPQN